MKPQEILFVAVAIIAIAIGIYTQTGLRQSDKPIDLNKIILLPQSKPIGNVAFMDHNGETFSEQSLLGKWSIVFFGFTNCPDICPTTLQTLSQVKAKLEAKNAWLPYQVIMVSVDPERDLIDKLKSYVPWFDKEFIGLAGELEYTREFAKRLGILFFKSNEQSASIYEVDHSASLILINPEGQYAGVITAPHRIDEIEADLLVLAKQYSESSASVNSTGSNPQTKIVEAPASSKTKQQDIVISNQWIRAAPPGVTSMAAYMSLSNTTSSDIVIKGIEAPDFEMAMIHDTVMENGIASMDHLDSLTIEPGKTVELAPLGKHVMLMQSSRALEKGSVSRLVLLDENGVRYPLLVEVKANETENQEQN